MKNPTLGAKFRALLATGRVANLPTVWSNVLVGYTISSSSVAYYAQNKEVHAIWICHLLFILAASSAIYVGGCMLGDVRDIHFDRNNRPNRPLPRGIVSLTTVSLTAWCLLLGGLLIITLSPLLSAVIAYQATWKELINFFSSTNSLKIVQLHEIAIATLLAGTVITYAFVHKKNRIVALTLMASCRLLLVLLAISVAHKSYFSPTYNNSTPLMPHYSWIAPWMILMAATVGLYTLLLSWVASTESLPGKFPYRKILAACMLALPAITLVLTPLILSTSQAPPYRWDHDVQQLTSVFPPPNIIPLSTFLILALAWIAFALKSLHLSKPAFVSRALAGFCLLDAALIASHSPTTALICLALFGLALLLQKVTPAT